jgi:hypothetical protein
VHAKRSRHQVIGRTVLIGFVTALGLYLLVLHLAQDPALAQSQTITIRPTTHDPGSTLGNPQNAYDNNDSTTSGASLSRTCSSNCTNPTSAFATWSGVPDGYNAVRLEVHWQLQAAAALFGNDTALIDGKLEYNLGAGWTILEEYTWTGNSPSCANDHGITCTDHVATLALSDSQSTGAIQVRATLTVQLPHCDNCTLRVSNDGGTIWVYDVRVIAGPPILTVSPNPVQRGGTGTFTITGAPGATISNWAFAPTGYSTVTRTVDTGSSTWSGVIVVPGTASVHVVLGGTGYDLSAAISITARDWAWTSLAPAEVANGTFATLPSPPVANGALGKSQVHLGYNFTTLTINDNGPNQGFQYVTAVSDNSSYYRYEISPDLENTSSQFYQSQCGNYNSQTNTGFISGAVLLSNTQEHEYGTTLGHYQQYTSAQNDPANNLGTLGEAQIAAPGTSVSTFVSQTQSVLDAAVNRITSAMSSEAACNSIVNYDTSCVYRGPINFSPYQTC